MGWILEFFFSGVPADIAILAFVVVAIWVAWKGGYNR